MTLALLVGAALAIATRRRIRFSRFSSALVPVAAVGNACLWLWATPHVLGWSLAGLGGWMYAYVILPTNGALSAAAVGVAFQTFGSTTKSGGHRYRTMQVIALVIALVANLILVGLAEGSRGNLTD